MATEVDLAIIGGGINGVAIAREGARRGLSVALVERADLGGGTTSASSKLIHGGLRYLQYGELGLVRESLHDRARLLRERPHLVRPMRLLIPLYEGGSLPAWKLRVGLTLYDVLSGADLGVHEALGRDEVLAREPALAPEGLRGGFTYPDAQIVFPERLTVELAREAAEAGAVIRTHTEVVEIPTEGPSVRGIIARDRLTGERVEIQAVWVVNAAGPWVDAIAALLAQPPRPRIGGTRGSHLVLRRGPGSPSVPWYVPARSDGRPLFFLPWREYLLVGTTDRKFTGDPGAIVTEPWEVEYLLHEAAQLYPAAGITRADVLYSYVGVRPLPASRTAEAAVTRRHFLVDHGMEDGWEGLYSVVGGKLTTHPSLAEHVLDELSGFRQRVPCASGDPQGVQHLRASAAKMDWPDAPVEHLWLLYGTRAERVLSIARERRELRERICPHNPDVAAQVPLAVDEEWARTLPDLLLRRTGLGTSACLGLDCAEHAARLMGNAAGWGADRGAAEVKAYRELIGQRALGFGR